MDDHDRLMAWLQRVSTIANKAIDGGSALAELEEEIRNAGFEPTIEITTRLSIEEKGEAVVGVRSIVTETELKNMKSASGKPN